METSGNKVGTRTPNWDNNGNEVGTKKLESGTRMGTKQEQSENKNPKVVGTKWEQEPQSGKRMGTK